MTHPILFAATVSSPMLGVIISDSSYLSMGLCGVVVLGAWRLGTMFQRICDRLETLEKTVGALTQRKDKDELSGSSF